MTQPVKKIRAGQISCALWENEVTVGGRKISVLKATVERRYKDASGEWKSSQSFGRQDIPLVRWALDKAFGLMIEEQSSQAEDISEEQVQ
jgi:hypothetical protein